MLDDWKASTDRSLANTESILRSISQNRSSATKTNRSGLLLNSMADSLQTSVEVSQQPLDVSYQYRQRFTLSSDIDRLFANVKQEMESKSQQVQAHMEETKKEVVTEVSSRLAGMEEELEDLKKKFGEEREKRSKAEKTLNNLLRWQEEVRYFMDDYRRKVEEMEEHRSNERKEMRREMMKKHEEAAQSSSEVRKEVEQLRVRLNARQVDKESTAVQAVQSMERSITAMVARCDRMELAMETKEHAESSRIEMEKKMSAMVVPTEGCCCCVAS
eukprot:531506-Hanusia_phi.AAC.3